MKNKHTIWVSSLIVVLWITLIGALVFRSPKNAYTGDTTKESFLTGLLNELSDAKSRKWLLDIYCTYTAKAQWFKDAGDQGLYYDPQQSLFLGLLCNQSAPREKTSKLVRWYDWSDLWLSGCDRDGNMTSCDFSVFLPKLFAIVMNDLSKLKVSQLYSFEWSSPEEAAKAFSDTYFGPGDTICGSKNLFYLGVTEWSDKEAPCLHPQTHTILVQYIQQSKQIADQTTYIDASKLFTAKPKDCDKNSDQFLLCAYTNTNSTYSREAFHNTVYNELLFYKLLISIASDRFKYPEFNKFRVYSDTSEEARQEIIRLSQEASLSQDAIIYMEKTLQNMQATFPVHIGLLAYYEDVLEFRKALVKIYTPIHQLYYKLRNVQQKQ